MLRLLLAALVVLAGCSNDIPSLQGGESSTALLAPRNVVAVATASAVSVSWNQPETLGQTIQHYEVTRLPDLSVTTVTERSLRISPPPGRYWFRVVAVSGGGRGMPAESNAVEFPPGPAVTPPVKAATPQPQLNRSYWEPHVTVSWPRPGGIPWVWGTDPVYRVEGHNPDSPTTDFSQLTATMTVPISLPPAGEVLQVRVRVEMPGVYSDWGTLEVQRLPVPAATALWANPRNGAARIGFTQPEVPGLQLNGQIELIPEGIPSGWDFTGLTNGTEYRFRVHTRSVDGESVSAPSRTFVPFNVRTVVTRDPVPARACFPVDVTVYADPARRIDIQLHKDTGDHWNPGTRILYRSVEGAGTRGLFATPEGRTYRLTINGTAEMPRRNDPPYRGSPAYAWALVDGVHLDWAAMTGVGASPKNGEQLEIGATLVAAGGGVDLSFARLDADATADLVLADATANAVRWFPGNGDRTFGSGREVALGAAPSRLVTDDVDADGDMDLLILTATDARVAYNAGDGTFAIAIHALPSSPKALTAADLDLDGRKELVVSAATSPLLWIFRSTADGGLVFGQEFALLGVAEALASGDFTGDGRPDLLTGGDFGGVLPTTTAGMPGERIPAEGYRPVDFAVDDLDQDGDLDAFAAMLEGGALTNTGNGSLRWNGSPWRSVRKVALGDLDGDGRRDAVLLWTDSYYSSPPIDRLGVQIIAPVEPEDTNRMIHGVHPALDVDLADLDGDGDADGAFLAGDGSVKLLDNKREPPCIQDTVPLPSFGERVAHLGSGEFHDDGRPDVVGLGAVTGALRMFRGRGEGELLAPVELAGSGISAFTTSDLDLDGFDELVALQTGLPSARVWQGSAQGPSLSGDLALIAPATALTAGDLDHDGQPELVFAHPDANAVTIYARGEGVTFALRTRHRVAGRPREVAVTDLDGDGWDDLLVSRAEDVLALRNDRQGGFVFATSLPAPNLRTPLARDWNRDAHWDLTAVDAVGGALWISHGRGDGTYSPAVRVPLDAPGLSQLQAPTNTVALSTTRGELLWFGDTPDTPARTAVGPGTTAMVRGGFYELDEAVVVATSDTGTLKLVTDPR